MEEPEQVMQTPAPPDFVHFRTDLGWTEQGQSLGFELQVSQREGRAGYVEAIKITCRREGQVLSTEVGSLVETRTNVEDE